MKNIDKEVCIFGGCYFASEYIIYILTVFLQFLIQHLPQNSNAIFIFLSNALAIFSGLMFALFVVFLLRYLFTQKSLSIIGKIYNKFPKTSVYLYYLGYAGYILLALNALLLIPLYTMNLSEIVQNIIVWILIIANILGLLLPLVFASYQVFYKHKSVG